MPVGSHHIVEAPDMAVTMPDGTRLSARVWMPDNAPLAPLFLEYPPYRKRDGYKNTAQTLVFEKDMQHSIARNLV